jgi:quinol monooxygenase YgiN
MVRGGNLGDQSLVVELAIKSGRLQRFQELTGEMVEAARREPGVEVYQRFVSDDGTLVHVFERYPDSPAAVAHLRGFAERFGDRFASLVDRRNFTV